MTTSPEFVTLVIHRATFLGLCCYQDCINVSLRVIPTGISFTWYKPVRAYVAIHFKDIIFASEPPTTKFVRHEWKNLRLVMYVQMYIILFSTIMTNSLHLKQANFQRLITTI